MTISLRAARSRRMSDSRRSAPHRGRRLAAVAVGATIAMGAGAGPAMAEGPPAIQPPGGNMKYLTLHAEGTQNYLCQNDGTGNYAWTFVGPNASLYNAAGAQVGSHALNPATGRPVWSLFDGSRVEAMKVASAPSPVGAIPWLLLQVTDQYTTWNLFNGFNSYVQRINTVGGQQPIQPCNWLMAAWYPYWPMWYSADYVFYYYFG